METVYRVLQEKNSISCLTNFAFPLQRLNLNIPGRYSCGIHWKSTRCKSTHGNF